MEIHGVLRQLKIGQQSDASGNCLLSTAAYNSTKKISTWRFVFGGDGSGNGSKIFFVKSNPRGGVTNNLLSRFGEL